MLEQNGSNAVSVSVRTNVLPEDRDIQTPTVSAGETESLTETQRSKRLTDAYAEAVPMCKWVAVNGVVLSAIRSGKFADDEIRAALLRLAAENRSVTIDSLRTELVGFPRVTSRGQRRGAPLHDRPGHGRSPGRQSQARSPQTGATMTPDETVDLLTVAAAFDQRTVGEGDAMAWYAVVGDLDFAEAKQAVIGHYSGQHRPDHARPCPHSRQGDAPRPAGPRARPPARRLS